MSYAEPRHPINFVAKRTGLTTHTIRVWERRYGAVVPQRTDTNRRLYSDADVDKLRLLAQLSNAGHTISRIADLPKGELEGMVQELTARSAPVRMAAQSGKSVEEYLAAMEAAVANFDDAGLESLLSEAKLSLSRPQLLENLIGPLMTWIGDQWESGDLRIGHEHMASGVVRDFLGNLRTFEMRPSEAPVVIVTTPAGQAHEIGAQLAAAVAASVGWCDVYLGPNLPAQEIANVAIRRGARAIALSICMFMANSRVLAELEELRRYVPEEITIIAGGRGAAKIRGQLEDAGIMYLETFAQFREHLAELSAQPV